jgi:hypothetical protein
MRQVSAEIADRSIGGQKAWFFSAHGAMAKQLHKDS